MARTTPDPLDAVRDAFSDLRTGRKAAFVLEATFDTISQALAETGRRAAEVIDDLEIDNWFETDHDEAEVGAPPPPPPVTNPPTKRKPAAKKKPASKKGGDKTAGRIPPDDAA